MKPTRKDYTWMTLKLSIVRKQIKYLQDKEKMLLELCWWKDIKKQKNVYGKPMNQRGRSKEAN